MAYLVAVRVLGGAAALIAAIMLAGCAGGASLPQADAQSPGGLRPNERAAFEHYIGKKQWTIATICNAPTLVGCTTGGGTVNGYFTIRDVVAQEGEIYFAVSLDDGRQGYIPLVFSSGFQDDEPSVALKKRAAECKRLGIPRVGMSVKQVEATCWGKPDHVNRTETAGAITDQYVYGDSRYVYLRNGVVTSIQTSGTLR